VRNISINFSVNPIQYITLTVFGGARPPLVVGLTTIGAPPYRASLRRPVNADVGG